MLRDLYERMTRGQLIERAVELGKMNDILEEIVRTSIENEKLRKKMEAIKAGKVKPEMNLVSK